MGALGVPHGGKGVVWLLGCDPWALGSEAVFSTIEASLASGVGQSIQMLPGTPQLGSGPLTQSLSLWHAGSGR